MRRNTKDTTSLDMLLDTMCNTFGGVCFIALMIALISASLPSGGAGKDSSSSQVSEQMLVDKERTRLVRERDELKAAIKIQNEFVSTNVVLELEEMSERSIMAAVSSNDTAVAKLKAEKLELEDALAKVTTDVAYSKREAARLSRLLKEMEEKLGKPQNMKNRAVRTPVERELGGYRSVDVWLRQGCLYYLKNPGQVDCVTRRGKKGLEWDYTVRIGHGHWMSEEFFHSSEYRAVIDEVGQNVFLRIYSDVESFTQLCILRDDLIRRKKQYNWHVATGDTIHFIEGYDGRVQ